MPGDRVSPEKVRAHPEPFDAIVLAGGSGSRLGGVDKAAVDLAGASLVSSSLEAVAEAETLVVVGRTKAALPANAVTTVEDPPGSGPAAAVVHGLNRLVTPCPWTMLLACDLPGAPSAVQRLLAASSAHAADVDGVVLTDPEGRLQWLLGLYRHDALVAAAPRLGDAAGRSLKALLGELRLLHVPAAGAEWHDVDTWNDHDEWLRRRDK